MKKYIFFFITILCGISCSSDGENTSIIRGHLIEGSSRTPLVNVKVTLYDNTQIYAIVFSDKNGDFSMATPSLIADYQYGLSFEWSEIYPAKEITITNIPKTFDLHEFIVYDKSNPYNYSVWGGYMIHKTLPGKYTFSEATAACKVLRDGYDDWSLPGADFLDLLGDDMELATQITESGWYWSSWIYFSETYVGVNVWNNATAYTNDPNEKLKVLPVRLINK